MQTRYSAGDKVKVSDATIGGRGDAMVSGKVVSCVRVAKGTAYLVRIAGRTEKYLPEGELFPNDHVVE